MKIIKTIDPNYFIHSVFKFPVFPKSDKKALSGFNILIDNTLQLNEETIKKIQNTINSTSEKNLKEMLLNIIKEIEKEEDIEIPVYNKDDIIKLLHFFNKEIKEKKVGGNAYYGYNVLKHIFSKVNFCYKGKIYNSIKEILNNTQLKNNIVIEYKKGIAINNTEIKNDSRLIISDRSSNIETQLCREGEYDFYFLSGYHHLKNKEEIKKAMYSLKDIKGYKHTELSELSFSSLKEEIIESILYNMNSIGMNDIEAKSLFNKDPLHFDEFSESIKHSLPKVDVIFIHSKQYMMVILNKNSTYNYRGVFDSIMFAQKMGIIKLLYDPQIKDPQKYWNEIAPTNYTIQPINKGYGIYEDDIYRIYLSPTILIHGEGNTVGLGDVISSSFASYLYYENFDQSQLPF